jgi:chaperone required for assembly of F1-ATPase
MKKFWKNVEIQKSTNNTFQILLDKNILKTPVQNELFFSNYNIAYEASLEWDINSDTLNADDMVFFGIYCTAIDRISSNRKLYINEIIGFVDTDLICYRAEKPIELIQLQNTKWDPILSIVKAYTDLEIDVFQGIMPGKQNIRVHNKIKKLINNFSDLEISILYRMTNITGSIFISLCVLKRSFLEEALFELCYLDELWQAKKWGFEEEASTKRNKISKELKKIVALVSFLKN